MTVFAIIASTNPSVMGAAVVAQYGANHHQFAENVWLVADIGSTRSVSDKLKITNGEIGALGVVVEVAAYAGYASAGVWQWLQQYPEARSSG